MSSKRDGRQRKDEKCFGSGGGGEVEWPEWGEWVRWGGIANGRTLSSSAALDVVVVVIPLVVVLTNVLWKMFH